MSEKRDNSGALFRVVESEKKTDRWPDYKGDVLINGEKWWISGWVRTAATGKKYLGLALRRADEKGAESTPAEKAVAAPDSDKLPF
jgi:hypothetical protein